MEEHIPMIFSVILEVRDLLKNINTEASWNIPDALAVSTLSPNLHVNFIDYLQENIQVYAAAFLLCPTLTYYRGKVANKLMVSSSSQ
jgi:hypothetical protein